MSTEQEYGEKDLKCVLLYIYEVALGCLRRKFAKYSQYIEHSMAWQGIRTNAVVSGV